MSNDLAHGTPVGVAGFSNYLPVRIRFGAGVAAELAATVAACDADAVLLVIDDGLEQANERVAASVGALERAGVRVARHVKSRGEPTSDDVDAAAATLRQVGARAIVAIGGGSVMDTAKAARLCVETGTAFADLAASGPSYPVPEISLIALPSTAGTGSEVSGGAVVTNAATHRKAGIANATLRAQAALVDPLLTHSMPPGLTAHTGVDALAQAIAGMVARTRTPIGDGIALESIRLIGRSLLPAYRDGTDAAARSEMSCGSLLAGLTMNISDCTAEHSLGQAIASLASVPHGLTIGVVLPAVLERERGHVPEQLERVADALGVPEDGSGDGSRTVRGVRSLLAALDFPTLGALGIDRSRIGELTDLAWADFFITQAPAPWTRDEVVTAFAQAFDERDWA